MFVRVLSGRGRRYSQHRSKKPAHTVQSHTHSHVCFHIEVGDSGVFVFLFERRKLRERAGVGGRSRM